MNNMREMYTKLLLSGHAIEFKDISICRIEDYCPRPFSDKTYKYAWQVDCDNSRLIGKLKYADPEYGYSELHTNLNKAISEFLKIRRILYGKEISESKGKN